MQPLNHWIILWHKSNCPFDKMSYRLGLILLKLYIKKVIYELSMFHRDYLFPKGHATDFIRVTKLYILVYMKM